MQEQGDRLLHGRYRRIRLLGAGGVAEVWLALDERTGREVALKLLRPQYAENEALLERFRLEAQLIARLESPHIVQVYDVQAAGPDPLIAMEYVEGQDLQQMLRQEGPLPPLRALTLLRDIAEGIAEAHRAGLIHRDLKPGNILISPSGTAKITDFGIARDVAVAGLTEPGTVWGTSHYIAPEQAKGRVLSPATDIYSLGVLLFEMLTGRLPFPGNDPVAVALAHVQQQPPTVRSLAPSTPLGVADLVERMMAKESEQRPRDGAELLRIVTGYLGGSSEPTMLHAAVAAPESPNLPVAPVEEPSSPLEPVLPPVYQPGVASARVPSRFGALIAGLLVLIAFAAIAGAVVSRRAGAAAADGGEQAVATLPMPEPSPSVPIIPTFTAGISATATLLPASPTPQPSPTVTSPPVVISGPRIGNGVDALALPLDREGAIVIDGNLSEWNTARPVSLEQPVHGPERWQGHADLSGTAHFAWDDQFLYLAVVRTDDEHLQTREGYELYRDDSVELWLDTQLLADFDVAEANAGTLRDDFQFVFSAGDFDRLRAEGVAYHPDRDDQRNRDLQVRAEPLPDGYTLEARISWVTLGIQPEPNLVLGYVVVLNDNDTPQSDEPQTQVASNRQNPYLKPLTFGNLILTAGE